MFIHPLTTMLHRLLWLFLVLLAGCAAEAPDAETLIDRAIAAHGMERLDRAVVTFDFRGKRFAVRRQDGRFRFTRTYADSTGARVREVFSSDSLYRTVGGARQPLPPEAQRALVATPNSGRYFALLPYKLQDPAVQAQYLGRDTLRGTPYHQVEVTFRQEGGGRDWQDRFVYWLHPERHTMDYLAYYFHTDGGGSRFREAVNVRTIGGVRVADYLNYAAAVDTLDTAIHRYGEIMEAGRLELVSEIRLDSVQVRFFNE